MPDTALEGLRVIDVSSGIPGPWCAKMLGDAGADVIKVETPAGGDESRRTGPFFEDDPHPEKSLLFLYLNCNKRGVTLDIKTHGGRKIFREMIKEADVLVEDSPPGHLDRLGLGYQDLDRINAGLVLTSITPFGQTGPYRDYQGSDLVYYAMSGIQYASGAHDREPLKHGHPQSLYMAGLSAGYVTLAAIYSRLMTGRGQHVDLSIMEVIASHYVDTALRYTYAGLIEKRAPKSDGGSFKGVGFDGIAPVSDGYVSPTIQRGRQQGTFADYAAFLGAPEIADPKFETRGGRNRHARELDEALLPVLKRWKKVDYFEAAAKDGWIVGLVQTSEELANSRQLYDRGFYAEVEHPVIGKIKLPGDYLELTQGPWSLRRPAPLLGQHNIDIFCGEMGYSREDLVHMRRTGAI